MKKHLLFILVITQIGFISAQSLVVTGDTVITGDFNVQVEHHLDVKNISGSSISVVCQKTNISLPVDLPSF